MMKIRRSKKKKNDSPISCRATHHSQHGYKAKRVCPRLSVTAASLDQRRYPSKTAAAPTKTFFVNEPSNLEAECRQMAELGRSQKKLRLGLISDGVHCVWSFTKISGEHRRSAAKSFQEISPNVMLPTEERRQTRRHHADPTDLGFRPETNHHPSTRKMPTHLR